MRQAKQNNIDFTNLAGESLLDDLEKEFQYQMNLSDGCYFFWHNESFKGKSLSPALDAQSQAILQFFAECSCPISLHRLGCSLSPRNSEHGPITSNSLAIQYLLQGFETLANLRYDPKVQGLLNIYRSTRDYRLASELLTTYWENIHSSHVCPEVVDAMFDFKTAEVKH